ncbi:hypothetical protein HanRHA438_Chr13g0625741 [Helianthus annuus]|nr:hypothetical protein HanRHA438_Chr13g0625741 [Helianthus annuus]
MQQQIRHILRHNRHAVNQYIWCTLLQNRFNNQEEQHREQITKRKIEFMVDASMI